MKRRGAGCVANQSARQCTHLFNTLLPWISQGLPTIRAYRAGARFRSAFLFDLSDNGAW